MKILQLIIVFIISISFCSAQKLDTSLFKSICALKMANYDMFFKYEKYILDNQSQLFYPIVAEAYFQNGDFNKSEEWFKKAESFYPAESFYGLALCYAQQGKYSFALENLKKYLVLKNKKWQSEIKLDPGLQALTHLEEWRSVWRTEYYSKWEQQLADANYEFLQNRALNALSILDKLIESRPKMDEALALKASVYFALGNTGKAIEYISNAIKNNKKNAVYFAQRSAYYQNENRFKDALEDINQAINLASYEVKYYATKADVLLQMGKFQMALDECLFLFEMGYESADLYLIVAKAYQTLGQDLKSMEMLGKAIIKYPYTGQLYIQRGKLFFNSRAFSYAIKDLTMAMDFDPRNPDLYHQRGICRAEVGDLDGACRDFFKARELGLTSVDKVIRKYCLDQINISK